MVVANTPSSPKPPPINNKNKVSVTALKRPLTQEQIEHEEFKNRYVTIRTLGEFLSKSVGLEETRLLHDGLYCHSISLTKLFF